MLQTVFLVWKEDWATSSYESILLKRETSIRKLVFSCSFNKFIDDYCTVCLLNNCKVVWNLDVSCEGKWCSNTFNTKLFAGLNHRKFQLQNDWILYMRCMGSQRKRNMPMMCNDIKSKTFRTKHKLHCFSGTRIFQCYLNT